MGVKTAQAFAVLLMLQMLFVVSFNAGMHQGGTDSVRDNLTSLPSETVDRCLENSTNGVNDAVCSHMVGPTVEMGIGTSILGMNVGERLSWLPNGVSHAISGGLALLVVAQFFALLLYTASRIPGVTGT